MSKRIDAVLVEDILEAIDKIDKYVLDIDKGQFEQDDMRIDAVVRNLEIIGEAANRISKELKEKHSYIDWVQIRGLRNRIVHEYFGVSTNLVWTIVQKDLPVLRSYLIKLI